MGGRWITADGCWHSWSWSMSLNSKSPWLKNASAFCLQKKTFSSGADCALGQSKSTSIHPDSTSALRFLSSARMWSYKSQPRVCVCVCVLLTLLKILHRNAQSSTRLSTVLVCRGRHSDDDNAFFLTPLPVSQCWTLRAPQIWRRTSSVSKYKQSGGSSSYRNGLDHSD